MDITINHWIGFHVIILSLLAVDLWHFFNHPHSVSIKEALWTSFGWISLALFFNFWLYLTFGVQPALDFFTGYLIEKSLSIDNLFIFLILFSQFKVPETTKHPVLFYGVLGAILMRASLVWGGINLIHLFEWIFILFGIFLIFTGARLVFHQAEKEVKREYLLYQWLKKKIPFTSDYVGNAFVIQDNGRWVATPLLSILLLIEATDFLFALDSIPAILGITTEPFIVYTSNIFAILGLRSLFFALEGVMRIFHLLHYALAFILIFIGGKMIIAHFLYIPTWITLVVLAFALVLAIVLSLLYPSPNSIHYRK